MNRVFTEFENFLKKKEVFETFKKGVENRPEEWENWKARQIRELEAGYVKPSELILRGFDFGPSAGRWITTVGEWYKIARNLQ